MAESMSKKEKLARGSAVIKVMRVIPRPGNFLKSFVDPRKLPKTINPNAPKGVLADMPWLDVKRAVFDFSPDSAKVKVEPAKEGAGEKKDCKELFKEDTRDPRMLGLPDGDEMLEWFSYRTWTEQVNPLFDGNIAEHFNVMLGLLISMSIDPENTNFPDVEAYPCVQFLRSIQTPNGEIPYNTAALISYIEFICQKMVDEG